MCLSSPYIYLRKEVFWGFIHQLFAGMVIVKHKLSDSIDRRQRHPLPRCQFTVSLSIILVLMVLTSGCDRSEDPNAD